MERKKKKVGDAIIEEVTPADPIFRWKVVGGSPFHGVHRIYKPGEVFKATESEVPLAFRDVIVKVDIVSVQEQERVLPGKVATYSLKERETENEDDEVLFDVVNHNDKVINEKPLSKQKAELLIKNLTE